jgi:hypothetical protein
MCRIVAQSTQSTVLRSRNASIVISSGRPQAPQFTRIGSSVSMRFGRAKRLPIEFRPFLTLAARKIAELARPDSADLDEIADPCREVSRARLQRLQVAVDLALKNLLG